MRGIGSRHLGPPPARRSGDRHGWRLPFPPETLHDGVDRPHDDAEPPPVGFLLELREISRREPCCLIAQPPEGTLRLEPDEREGYAETQHKNAQDERPGETGCEVVTAEERAEAGRPPARSEDHV